MSLSDEERRTIVQREMKKAYETFEEIGILAAANRWSGAASRLYYAVFHAVNALFINDGLQAVRHNGSHTLFSLHYIKTGKLPTEYGRFYNQLQTLREKSEYNSFFDATQQDVEEAQLPARQLIDAIARIVAYE